MRFSGIFQAMCVLAAAGASVLGASNLAINKVETRYKTTSDFKSISEFFTGKESVPGVVLRTVPEVRDGMYFIIDMDWFKKDSLLLATQFEIDYIRSDDTQPRKAVFYLEETRSTLPEMQFGLTGPDWPKKDAKVLAYKVTIRNPIGEILAEKSSFLWDFPDEERAQLIAQGRISELPDGKLNPESDLKRPMAPLPIPESAVVAKTDAQKGQSPKLSISPERLSEIKASAQRGEAKGLVALGVMHLKGIGVEQDGDKALEYLRKAAEKGSTSADYNLGLMYARGEGTARNAEQARFHFQRAAEKGSVSAQYNLGHLYSYSGEMTPDGKLAGQWYERAAKQGFGPAQYNLAFLLTRGDAGIAIDLPKAYYWALIAEQSGQPNAKALCRKLESMLQEPQIKAVADSVKTFKAVKETQEKAQAQPAAPAQK